MPGREDLIQKNRAAVKARVESAGEQASTGGQKPTYSSHRSLMGANLDVISSLESIEFAQKGPLGDGSLRNSVAYIRYWARGGSKTTAETSAQTVDATQLDPGTDPQSELNRAIDERYGPEREGAQTIEYTGDFSAAIVTRADDGTVDYISTEVLDTSNGRIVQTNIESNTLIRDEDGNILEGFSETRFAKYNEQYLTGDLTQQRERQNILAQGTIPTTRTYSGDPRAIVVADTEQIEGGGIGSRAADQLMVGRVKPANPNGFVNATSRMGRNVLGLPPEQIRYSGVAGVAQGGSASVTSGGTLSKGMWQFLFNPSELEIEAGPEFRTAETWGVSDKANSGQPLNWSHNKNAQLKFNSVLLNGYVFGRKVEELEQGIFELFMSREGGGQAGPPILEFVWGKRVFGPCVIKDISIKEKMWDEGMVVNAELSFTLEQIPEWTINDGYVDVARPGKLPMVYDVTAPEAGSVGAGSTAPPGSTGAAPDQKSDKTPSKGAAQADFIACRNLQQLKLNAIGFNPNAGTYKGSQGGSLLPGIGSAVIKTAYQSNFTKNYNNYNSFVSKGNSLGVSTSNKCSPSTIKAEHNRLTKDSTDSLKEIADKQMASFMNTCAAELGKKAERFFDQKGCKRFADEKNPNKSI